MTKDDLSAFARLLGEDTREHVAKKIAAVVEPLERRLAALEAKAEITVKYAGVFKHGERYRRGDAVTHRSAFWVCTEATDAVPGSGETPWRLASKSDLR